ncbi:MAG TPA: hypothetical protein VK797_09170 [Tepidisphaeraceae bacterium]|nr:hypothetical protein [Tepidisphaeraceae bacterium]
MDKRLLPRAAKPAAPAGGDPLVKWNAAIVAAKPHYPDNSANYYEATSVSQKDNVVTFHLTAHGSPAPLTPSGSANFQKLLLSTAGGYPAGAPAPSDNTQYAFVVDKPT